MLSLAGNIKVINRFVKGLLSKSEVFSHTAKCFHTHIYIYIHVYIFIYLHPSARLLRIVQYVKTEITYCTLYFNNICCQFS